MRLCSITPAGDGAWELRAYEIDHSAASEAEGRNSSGETFPPVAALIRAANSQDGRLTPRLMREIALRSTPTHFPKAASSKPCFVIQSDRVMKHFVHHKHISCQVDCASGAVDLSSTVRRMHSMAKAKKSKRKPKFTKHFVLEWREAFNLGQEELAGRMGYSHSTVQRVETMQTAYTQQFLEKAGHVFGCHPGLLLMRPPRPEEIPNEIVKTGS